MTPADWGAVSAGVMWALLRPPAGLARDVQGGLIAQVHHHRHAKTVWADAPRASAGALFSPGLARGLHQVAVPGVDPLSRSRVITHGDTSFTERVDPTGQTADVEVQFEPPSVHSECMQSPAWISVSASGPQR